MYPFSLQATLQVLLLQQVMRLSRAMLGLVVLLLLLQQVMKLRQAMLGLVVLWLSLIPVGLESLMKPWRG